MHAARTDLFESSAMLMTFILLGKLLEARAKRHTCHVLTQLMSMAPESAALVTLAADGTIATEQAIDCRLVQCGDLLHVLAGQKVPADGQVVQVSNCTTCLPTVCMSTWAWYEIAAVCCTVVYSLSLYMSVCILDTHWRYHSGTHASWHLA